MIAHQRELDYRDLEIRRLRAFLNISRLMNAEMNHSKLIERINEEVRAYLEADRFTVFFHDSDTNELYSYIASGLKPGDLRIPSSQGVAGYVFKTGKMICIENAYDDPHFNPEIDRKTGYRTRSLLSLPITNSNTTRIGVVQALNKLTGDGIFTGEDVIFLRELVFQISGLLNMVLQKEKLARQHEALQEALSHLVIFSVNREGKLTHVSANIEGFLGYQSSDVIGRPLTDFIDKEDVPQVVENYRRIVNGQTAVSAEYRMIGKGGEMRWMRDSSRPILANGKIIGIQGGLTDITERKMLEERLRQAQKIESIGRLAGGIAHDFNNLFLPIIGYTEMALTQIPPEESLFSDLELILDAAQRAKSLTNQLLAFSRKQVLNMRILNLSHTVADFEKILQRLIGEDVEVETKLDPMVNSVRADPSQLQQILMNLAVNARDAMPHGGRLTIETANVYLDEEYARRYATVQAGPHVMLAVSDTGHGMDEETLRQVFEPFFTTKDRTKGTGLGLATVYGIVKQHGGSIWPYSEPGQGTVFKIYLPKVDEVPEDDGGAKPPTTNLRGSETILVVEDEAMVRGFVRDILNGHGYKVIEAESGLRALDISRGFKGIMDLLVTDVIMPQMTGSELARRIVALRPDIRVLYMSGYTDDVIAQHGILDADVNFLQKPFTVQSLTERVRDILDSRNGG
jgi:two-component system, cell cycle sensor histidine kinase and response regulator CckA